MTKICENCGKVISDNAVFCRYCGAKVTVKPVNVSEKPKEAVPVQPSASPKPQAPKKGLSKTGKILIIGGAAAAVAVVGVVFWLMNRPTKIDVLKDVTLSAEGYSSMADAKVDGNEQQGFNEALENIEKKNQTNSVQYQALTKIADEIECGWDGNDQNLSNDDVITYACKLSDTGEQLAKKYHYQLDDMSKSYTISGLEELQEVDLFDGVTVGFDADSKGMLNIMIEVPEDSLFQSTEYEYTDYDAQKHTVNVELAMNEEALAKKGYRPKDGMMQKTYTLDAQPVLVTHFSDSDGSKAAADQAAKDLAEAEIKQCNPLKFGSKEASITGYTIKSQTFTGEGTNGNINVDITYALSNNQESFNEYTIWLFKRADGTFISSISKYYKSACAFTVVTYGY